MISVILVSHLSYLLLLWRKSKSCYVLSYIVLPLCVSLSLAPCMHSTVWYSVIIFFQMTRPTESSLNDFILQSCCLHALGLLYFKHKTPNMKTFLNSSYTAWSMQTTCFPDKAHIIYYAYAISCANCKLIICEPLLYRLSVLAAVKSDNGLGCCVRLVIPHTIF